MTDVCSIHKSHVQKVKERNEEEKVKKKESC